MRSAAVGLVGEAQLRMARIRFPGRLSASAMTPWLFVGSLSRPSTADALRRARFPSINLGAADLRPRCSAPPPSPRGPQLWLVASAPTVIRGRPAVNARVATVRGRVLAVVASVGARLHGHLRRVLCEPISHGGAKITPGGRLVARLGGAVALVRGPVVLIPVVG